MHAKPEEKPSRNGLIAKNLAIVTTIITVIGGGFAAWIANNYQSKMSAATLISQREQAESQLRATMFSNLISPIVGSYKDGGKSQGEIPLERERLLVEMLALNFHDHFEFKPFLIHVDKRLATELDKDEREKAHESLKSVTRRVISRQIATILNLGSKKDKTEIQTLNIFELPQDEKQRKDYEELKKYFSDSKYRESGVYLGGFGDEILLESPDKSYSLYISIKSCNWDNETCEVYFRIHHKAQENEKRFNQGEQPHFTLTWFDFPFTDNTLLADGNRFAVVLDQFSGPNVPNKSVVFKIIWFPKVYFTPRERPINYTEIREKLGIEAGK